MGSHPKKKKHFQVLLVVMTYKKHHQPREQDPQKQEILHFCLRYDPKLLHARLKKRFCRYCCFFFKIDAYIHMLVLLYCIDNKRIQDGLVCSDQLMQKVVTHNRRTLDLLAARCYFYHSRTYELAGKLDAIRRYILIFMTGLKLPFQFFSLHVVSCIAVCERALYGKTLKDRPS